MALAARTRAAAGRNSCNDGIHGEDVAGVRLRGQNGSEGWTRARVHETALSSREKRKEGGPAEAGRTEKSKDTRYEESRGG